MTRNATQNLARPGNNGRIVFTRSFRARLDRHVVDRKTGVYIGIVVLAAFFVLFEVSFNFRFALPDEKSEPDATQESLYAACYAERDKEIHATAFGTIDNPDVQKLYILNNRAQAATECRQEYPERQTMVKRPFQFNLIDLRFRFGGQE